MKKCNVCGKVVERIVKGMCMVHYNKSKYITKERGNYKIIKERTHRPNDYIKYNTYAEIILCDKFGNERARAKVDLNDVKKCILKRWGVHSKGYVQTFSYGKFELLHQYLMNPSKGNYVDHINHDTLDNRRCNLRVVTPHQSNLNQNLRLDNTSGHRGISLYERDSTWESYIHVDGKKIGLGRFKELQDAITARKDAEVKYYETEYLK